MSRRPDFARLKQISLEQAISFLNLKMKRNGTSEGKYPNFRCVCPAHGGDEHALSITPDKPAFRCMVVEKGGTDACALVAHVRGITQTEAGLLLQDEFLSARAEKAPSAAQAGREVQALDYLVPEHPVAEMLGLSAAVLQALGAGYAPRGTMSGRLLIPLRMEDGQLCGYLGIACREDQEPLLKFPANLEEVCTAKVVRPTQAKKQPDELRKLFRVVNE
jgi:hypothetical protein